MPLGLETNKVFPGSSWNNPFVMEVGNLVELKDKDRIVCAVVLSPGEKQWNVLTADGRAFKIAPEKILHEGPRLDVAGGKEALIPILRARNERREALKSEIQLRLLWDTVGQEDVVRSAEELAAHYFGSGCGPDEVAAMIRALHHDWGYFRPRGHGFFPVDARTVEMMEEGRKQQAEHRLREEAFVSWLATGGEGPLPEGCGSFVEAVKDFLVYGEQSGKARQAQEWMKKGRVADLDQAFSIFERNGILNPDENLLLRKYKVPGSFSEKMEKEATEILTRVRPSADRLDLTAIPTYTIDDEHTTDIDDALSLEITPQGWRVGVHIADVAEIVPAGSAMDKEAHTRSTSIYLPDEKITMFPDSITNAASLNAGELRPALSVLVDFHKNGQMTGWAIRETLIRVKARMTYDQVEKQLDEDSLLSKLYQIAFQLQEDRRKSGALIVQFPKVEIWVDRQSGRITVRNPKPKSRSQVLVSEWMILANRLVANHCNQQGIPVLYRAQQAPGKIFPLNSEDWVNLFRQRRYLRRGEVTVQPLPHFGLGLPVYLQMTSPIRRYSDLVIHRQLKAHLRGEPLPYTIDDLEAIRAYSERWVEIADLVEKEWRRYWLLKFLAGRVGDRMDAVVLESNLNDYLLFIPAYSLETSCARGMKSFSEGDTLQVRIELVKPREGVLKVIPLVTDS